MATSSALVPELRPARDRRTADGRWWLATTLVLVGCSFSSPYGLVTPERDARTCANDLDDDIDGVVDCLDDGCDAVEVCQEDSEASCSDRDDNDVDGAFDCYDTNCVSAAVCQEDGEASCSDGDDNDVDGVIDCYDRGCEMTDACQEDDDARCDNGEDDDGDGDIDCLDDGCDGRCPEEDGSYCADRRDNDGDGMTDAADARCWPFRRVEAVRCSSIDTTELVELFDDPFRFAGDFYTAAGDAGIAMTGDGLPALLLASTAGRAELGTVGTVATFRGGFAGFDLSVLVNVLVEGTAARVALVPADLAPLGAPRGATATGDLLGITLQDRVTAVFVGTSGVETLPWTGAGWQRLTIREVDGFLEATVAPVVGLGTGVRAVFAPIPLGALLAEATPSFRIVIDTVGAIFIRDLRLDLRGFDPCGTTVPQIPPGALVGVPGGVVSMGEGVSIARAAAPVLCALVAGCEWEGSGTWPTTRSFYSIDEGARWTRGDHAFERSLSSSFGRRGLSVAWDAERGVFRALGTGGRDASGGLPLAVAESSDCRRWSAATVLDLRYVPTAPETEACGAAGAGVARPSYVVRRVGGVSRHEIYWTQTARPRDELVLFRSVSTDGVSFGEPTEVVRFGASDLPGEPLSVGVIGATDLVLTSPLGPRDGRSGIAVRIALDEAGSRFALLGDVLLAPSQTPGTFDRFQIVSGALASTSRGAVLLYGAAGDFHFDPFVQTDGNLSAGTASVEFSELVEAGAP